MFFSFTPASKEGREKQATMPWQLSPTIPKRYILSLLAFFGFFNAYVLRSNLSIAIITMVAKSQNASTIGYDWNSKTQGYILSSFFYGYTIIQIPAGFLATILGGKVLFGGGVGLCALLTLLTPFCARLGPTALIILRIFEGLSSGFIYPSSHAIWSKWAPKNDKSKLTTFAFSGSYIGTLVTMMVGGLIAAYWSWEWIFYLSGVFGLIWTAIWFYFVAESPSTHPTISSDEVNYIDSNLSHSLARDYTIPWTSILTSLPVWAIIAAHFGTNWSIYVMFTELPIFLTGSLGYRVDQAGFLAAIPWLSLALLVYGAGLLSDRLTEQHSTGYVRKLIMAISLIIISLALLMATVLDSHHRLLIIVCIIIAIGSCGPAWASFGVNHLDIGGHYAGILMGLSNCIGSTPGFLVPLLTGYIVEHPDLKREWNIIFMLSILICIFVLMFYTFFASGDLQSWASNTSDEYQHVLTHSAGISRDVSQSAGLDDLTDRIRAEIREEKATE